MNVRKKGISFGNVVSILSIVSFLMVAQGALMNASAAEWDLWPKGRGKDAPTGETLAPGTPEAEAAAKAGEEGGKTVSAGMTSGTVGIIALFLAGAIGVGLALGGTSSTPRH